ncbi:hypothetical protein DPMN_024757 [Dreissena polymorpha]|uniref:Uncharacterized protein n=1 Tax=Dreissena polymorpha TaxID=45954 RepID=A0A9D4LRZ3_DREPO|nr:hypothetical protein DPMN_024757 [Dreissena polymorpha]
MCIFVIFFCALVAQTSAEKNRDTSLDDLSKYDKSVYRGNIGVVLDGSVTPTASWWYHSFVVSLPIDDMTSIIRKTLHPRTESVKVSNSINNRNCISSSY